MGKAIVYTKIHVKFAPNKLDKVMTPQVERKEY